MSSSSSSSNNNNNNNNKRTYDAAKFTAASVVVLGFSAVKEAQQNKKTKTDPQAITTAHKHLCINGVIVKLLDHHKKFPRNFLVVCSIRYLLLALSSASKAKPGDYKHIADLCVICRCLDFAKVLSRDEEAEKEKDTDLTAAHYVCFQEVLRELYQYHSEYPWDTTIRATIEMLGKKLVYVCEDGKDDLRDSSHLEATCTFCNNSFTMPPAPIPFMPPVPYVRPPRPTGSLPSSPVGTDNNNNNSRTTTATTTTTSVISPVYSSDEEESDE